LSTEHGLVMYRAMATIITGWASIGGRDEGQPIEQMRQGIAACQVTGAQLMRPHFLSLLAEALEPSSRDDEGLRLLDDALAMTEATGERCYQAELYRLKGERLLARASHEERSQAAGGGSAIDASSSVPADAEGCFMQSLAIARAQAAHSLELRAAMSLARLHQGRGTGKKALDLVASIYGRFTEGFDTLDLRDAKALIDAGSTR